jgi:hypothetical protein
VRTATIGRLYAAPRVIADKVFGRHNPCYFLLGAFPIPERPRLCGDPAALSEILRVPVSAVVSSTGLKVTETLQLLPGRSVFSHCDFTANTDGDALSISTVTGIPVFLAPSFLIVTVSGLLVFPTLVFVPKFSEEGLIDTIPTGVGVGVGVRVGVRVGVGVGVRVGVAVAVGAAVAVRLAVAVAVAVVVAVAVFVGVAVAVEVGVVVTVAVAVAVAVGVGVLVPVAIADAVGDGVGVAVTDTVGVGVEVGVGVTNGVGHTVLKGSSTVRNALVEYMLESSTLLVNWNAFGVTGKSTE